MAIGSLKATNQTNKLSGAMPCMSDNGMKHADPN